MLIEHATLHCDVAHPKPMLQPKLRNMSEIEMPLSGLPAELSKLEAGEEVHLKVVEKTADSIRFSVGPCGHVEDDMGEDEEDDEGGGYGGESEEAPRPGKKLGKGLGILIMVGGKKK